MPRLHVDLPLSADLDLDLPEDVARHVQVLRLQPGDGLTLFDGRGGEWPATVTAMGRRDVRVQVGAARVDVDREPGVAVTLAAVMPANDRMDWLVEKATELGVAAITPLLAERSVLKLKGERGDKKRAHWQAVAVAACEQCGRNRVPDIPAAQTLPDWLADPAAQAQATGPRLVLSLRPGGRPLSEAAAVEPGPVTFLSGPEGGLSPAEEDLALRHGFLPVTLGPRVLRAETAPLAALAALVLG